MPWLESIGLTMVQNADDVACLAAPLVILHHKLVVFQINPAPQDTYCEAFVEHRSW
jgi:hypothetical protein